MLVTALLPILILAARNDIPLPDANEVMSTMLQKDAERRSVFQGYSAVRTYVLENSEHAKRAEMTVRIVCGRDGAKTFDVLAESGWGGARKHVFPRLLEAEASGSKPGNSEESRIDSENYSFRMIGAEFIRGREAYAIEVIPKLAKKYLIRGTIWVDTEDYAILRMEGSPAKSPSFFIKSVKFTHMYQKNGTFWLPVSDVSVSDARIFGPTELTILYRDYQLASDQR